MQFKLIQQQTLYQGFFRLKRYTLQHELFGGGWSGQFTREILDRGKAVAVLLHDPENDKLLLIEQFRPGAIDDPQGAWMLEIVAGIVESGEDDADVARRESMEEAGCVVSEVEPVLEYYPSSGGCNETISLYYAAVDLSNTQPGIHGLDSENEDIRTHIISLDTALEWLERGRIKSSMTVIALQWLALKQLRKTIT
ncbi:MAG: NUDIX domain-containing protein [Thiolinea sp.]